MLDALYRRSKIYLPLLLLLLPSCAAITQSNATDKLAYIVTNSEGTPLKLYDPLTQSSGLLRSDIKFNHFEQVEMSIDGRLAYSSDQNGSADILVLDTQVPDSIPINITQSLESDNYPLGWSPDGRYLAFVSYISHDLSIYIWNGATIISITPQGLYTMTSAEINGISWSADGKLAFTVWNSFGVDPSEIYLWDGKVATNVSQNPTGRDEDPLWNTDGQLAFLSDRNGAYDIFVWDGVSYKNGLPDTDTFTNVAPDLTSYRSFLTWTNDNSLAFTARGSQDMSSQIYVWNGNTAINISQNPSQPNGNPQWSRDGRWAFWTPFAPQQLIYIRDVNNHTLLTVNGQWTPAWSSNGELAFCTLSYTGPNWTLSVWDGKTISKIAEGDEISAQWISGSSVFCSSG